MEFTTKINGIRKILINTTFGGFTVPVKALNNAFFNGRGVPYKKMSSTHWEKVDVEVETYGTIFLASESLSGPTAFFDVEKAAKRCRVYGFRIEPWSEKYRLSEKIIAEVERNPGSYPSLKVVALDPAKEYTLHDYDGKEYITENEKIVSI